MQAPSYFVIKVSIFPDAESMYLIKFSPQISFWVIGKDLKISKVLVNSTAG